MTFVLVLAVILTFLIVQWPQRVLPSVLRLAVVAFPAAAITAYFIVPFLLYTGYLNASPYLQSWKYDSYGANTILSWLLTGEFFDHGRLPVMTILLVLGIAWALTNQIDTAILAVVIFFVWLMIYFGRPSWGQLTKLFPLHEGLLFHRFSSAVDIGAILLIGLGGEWIWRQCERLKSRFVPSDEEKINWAPLVGTGIILILMLPALHERYVYYSSNDQWMRETRRSLEADHDAAEIIATLKTLPPGRTYAGLRTNWGNSMKWGDIHFYDLLTFNQIPAVSPPYGSMSLNSDLIWHFNDNNAAHYSLFNVKYAVAPAQLRLTSFFAPIKKTSRYTLYRVAGGGYEQFVHISDWRIADSQLDLFDQNRSWMLSVDPAASRFIRWSYLGMDRGPAPNPWDLRGSIINENVKPGRIDAVVRTPNPATLVFKMTYHPDWHVEIDGREQSAFMVSPSFIGVTIPPGAHVVSAIYESNRLKNALLMVVAFTLLITLAYGPAFSTRVEAFVRRRWPRA